MAIRKVAPHRQERSSESRAGTTANRDAQAQRMSAQAKLALAEAQLCQAQVNLERTRMRVVLTTLRQNRLRVEFGPYPSRFVGSILVVRCRGVNQGRLRGSGGIKCRW